jgi:hypothetical protein
MLFETAAITKPHNGKLRIAFCLVMPQMANGRSATFMIASDAESHWPEAIKQQLFCELKAHVYNEANIDDSGVC